MPQKQEYILFQNPDEIAIELADVAGGKLDGADVIGIVLPRVNAEPLRIGVTVEGALTIAAKLTLAALRAHERSGRKSAEGGNGSS